MLITKKGKIKTIASGVALGILVTLLNTVNASGGAFALDVKTAVPVKAEVLQNFKKIGIPVLSAEGKFEAEQARSFCIARLLSGETPSRKSPTVQEKIFFKNLIKLTPPSWSNEGLNVSVHCQGAFWVENNKITKIMPVSTGRAGYHTRVGEYVVTRQWNGWHNSTQYDVPLYKTSYFSGGQAVHGLVSDSLVKPYPASAGCVRMTKKDAKWVYDKVLGKKITIHGKW